jgi:zinc/manganese transport system ATP-binding protein
MSAGSGAIIDLQGIYTAYEGADRPVIKDASLQVGRGEFVIVGGPNGAGKTTLLESINGMLPLTHGKAMVCGMDVSRQGNEVRKKVGYVIQNFSFDPLMPFSVEQVVLMGRYGLLGWLKRPSEADYAAVESALHCLGIEDLGSRPIGKLSGGQQQKVLIAQNIARNPEILLLDEPFSNLDLCSRDFISTVLVDIVKSGCTVMMVSHAFDGLPDFTLRIVAMNDGCLCLDEMCSAYEVEEHVRQVCRVAVHA